MPATLAAWQRVGPTRRQPAQPHCTGGTHSTAAILAPFSDFDPFCGRYPSRLVVGRKVFFRLGWLLWEAPTSLLPQARWLLVGCSCGNLAFRNVNAADGRHAPPGTAVRIRLARRSARDCSPSMVLTCQVVPAGWAYLVSCSCGNQAFRNGIKASCDRNNPPEPQAEPTRQVSTGRGCHANHARSPPRSETPALLLMDRVPVICRTTATNRHVITGILVVVALLESLFKKGNNFNARSSILRKTAPGWLV
jgi:hypothetical protein